MVRSARRSLYATLCLLSLSLVPTQVRALCTGDSSCTAMTSEAMCMPPLCSWSNDGPSSPPPPSTPAPTVASTGTCTGDSSCTAMTSEAMCMPPLCSWSSGSSTSNVCWAETPSQTKLDTYCASPTITTDSFKVALHYLADVSSASTFTICEEEGHASTVSLNQNNYYHTTVDGYSSLSTAQQNCARRYVLDKCELAVNAALQGNDTFIDYNGQARFVTGSDSPNATAPLTIMEQISGANAIFTCYNSELQGETASSVYTCRFHDPVSCDATPAPTPAATPAPTPAATPAATPAGACPAVPVSVDFPVAYDETQDADRLVQTATVQSSDSSLVSIKIDDTVVAKGERLPSFLRKDAVLKANLVIGGTNLTCDLSHSSQQRARAAIQEAFGSNRVTVDDLYGNVFSPATWHIAEEVCGALPAAEKAQLQSETHVGADCKRSGCEARQDECALNAATISGNVSLNPLSRDCSLRAGLQGSANSGKAVFTPPSDAGTMTRGVAPSSRAAPASSDIALDTAMAFLDDLLPVEQKRGYMDSRACQLSTGLLAIDALASANDGNIWLNSQCQVAPASVNAHVTPTLGHQQSGVTTINLLRSVRNPGNSTDTNAQYWHHAPPQIHAKSQAGDKDFEDAGCDQSVPIDFAIVDETVQSTCNVIDDDGSPEAQITQLREASAAVRTEVHVCFSNKDQTDLLPADDRYDDIVSYFEKGDLSFMTRTSSGQDTMVPYDTTNTGRVRITTGAGDRQICYVIPVSAPPSCQCGTSSCSAVADGFQAKLSASSPSTASTLKTLVAPAAYNCGAEAVSSRLYSASISDPSGMTVNVALDADIDALLTGTVDDTTANAECQYSPFIRQQHALAIEQSANHLRLHAASGAQFQTAVRIGVFQSYGNVDDPLIHSSPVERVGVRSAVSMLVFQPYKTGVCKQCTSGDSVTELNKLLQSNVPSYNGAQDATRRISVQEISPLADPTQYGSSSAVFQSSLAAAHVDLNPKIADGTGCVAWKYQDAAATPGLRRMAETTRVDFRIRETTTCSFAGVRAQDQKKQSKEERHFFGAECSSDSAIGEGRVVRVMFASSYADVNFDLTLHEYGCDSMDHHYFIDGVTMEVLEQTRLTNGDTWVEVINAVIKNIKAKFPFDYSTQACGDLKFEAFLGLQDVRSCGSQQYKLHADSEVFAEFTISTRSQSLIGSTMAMQLEFDAQNAAAGVATELNVQSSDGKAVKVASLFYSQTGGSTAKALNSDTPTNQNHVLTLGDGKADGDGHLPRASNSSVQVRDTGHLGYDVTTRWTQSRDQDYVTSLEVTDFTDIVSYHDYKNAAGGDDYCDYDSDILTLMPQGDQDSNVDSWITNNPQLNKAGAAFVVRTCFGVDGANATQAETVGAAIDRGYAYQMIFGKTASASASAASTRRLTRYSIFASVDAMAVAVGAGLDNHQGCVPCETLRAQLKSTAQAAGMPTAPYEAATGSFLAECKRSRAAQFSTTLAGLDADSCPVAGFDATELLRGALPLLTSQFPALVTRPGSRDPFRFSVSLDIYDWLNRATQVNVMHSGEVTRASPPQFFTVAPQPADDSALGKVPAIPLHEDDFKCALSWDQSKSSSKYISYGENDNTGDDLDFSLTHAKAHYNGVLLHPITGAGAGTFSLGGIDNITAEYAFVPDSRSTSITVYLDTCQVGQQGCVKMGAHPNDKTSHLPVGLEFARLLHATLLSDLDDGHVAQSESLTDGGSVDRCAQRSWTQYMANSSLEVNEALATDLVAAILQNQNLDLSDKNYALHKHVQTQDKGVWGGNLQTALEHCRQHCVGTACGAPNVTSAYSSRYNTVGGTGYKMTTVFPDSVRKEFALLDKTRLASFVGTLCGELKSYVGTSATDHSIPDFGNSYTASKAAGVLDTTLTFLNDYHSEVRQPFFADASGNQGCTAQDDRLRFGMQASMAHESQTRPEYAGGSITVSSCQVLPALPADHDTETDQSTHRTLYIDSQLNNGDADRKTQKARFPDAAPQSQRWLEYGGSPNAAYMFEMDQYNIGDRNSTADGESHSARHDTLSLSVGFDFMSNAHYQDLRPVNFTLDITIEGGHQVNDLFDARVVLDDVAAPGTARAVRMTQSASGSHEQFEFDFNQVDHNATARYQPVDAAMAKLGTSSCAYVMTVADHDPSRATDVKYMTETQDISASSPQSAGACHKIMLYPKTVNLGFDKINVNTCVSVKDGGDKDASIQVGCADNFVEVVNVAGQPQACAGEHMFNTHKTISNAPPLNRSSSVCVHAAGSNGEQLAAMEHGKFAVIAQSLGRIDSFVRISINVASSSFSEGSRFKSDGSGKIADHMVNPTAAGEQVDKASDVAAVNVDVNDMYRIPCEFDTTCKFYGEGAYLTICSDNDMQLAQTRLDTSTGSYQLFRYKPLSGTATNNATICDWANATDSGAYAAAQLMGIDVADFMLESLQSTEPIEPAVEAPSAGAKGGRAFRVKIATTSVLCTDTVNNLGCTVGYQIEGDNEQLRGLVYAAGAELHVDNSINIKMFVTTFTEEAGSTDHVMAIDGLGRYTRSGVMEWNAKVATIADIGGVCTKSVSLTVGGGEDIHGVSFYHDSFDAASAASLGDKSGDDLIAELRAANPNEQAASSVLGAVLGSTKDLEVGASASHFRDFTVKVGDETLQLTSSMQAVDVTFLSATMLSNSSQAFKDGTDLVPGSKLSCANPLHEALGYCRGHGDAKVTVKVGSANHNEEVKVAIGKPAGWAADDLGNDMLICLGVSLTQNDTFALNNVVDQCREICIVALDPDVSTTTVCSDVGCTGGAVEDFGHDSRVLAKSQCATTMPAGEAQRLVAMAHYVELPASAPATITDSSQGAGVRQTIAQTRSSSIVQPDTPDLDLSSALETAATSTSHLAGTSFPGVTYANLQVSQTSGSSVSVTGSVVKASTLPTSNLDTDIVIATSGMSVALKSTEKVVADAALTSGKRLLAINQVFQHASPYAETTTSLAAGGVCRVRRTQYAAAASDAAGYTSATQVCLGGETSHCQEMALQGVGGTTKEMVARAGFRDAPHTDADDLYSTLVSDTYATCGADPDTRMVSAPERCDIDGNDIDIMAGVHTFAIDRLFYESGGACTAGPGIQLTLSRDIAITAGATIVDSATTSQPVCLHTSKAAYTMAQGSSCPDNGLPIEISGTGLTRTLSVDSTTALSMCGLMAPGRIMRLSLTGKLFDDASGDRSITVALVEVKAGGLIQIDNSATSVDIAKINQGQDDAMQVKIERSEASAAITNFLSLSTSAVYGGSADNTASADVWVSLKVCMRDAIDDARALQVKGPKDADYNDMVPETRVRFGTANSTKLVCGTRFVHIEGAGGVVQVKADRPAGGSRVSGMCGADADCDQEFVASLCHDIEGMAECIVIPHVAGQDQPSGSTAQYMTRAVENGAVASYQSGFSSDTEIKKIKCNPSSSATNCGWLQPAAAQCAASTMSFDPDTRESNLYTAVIRSGMDGNYASNALARHDAALTVEAGKRHCVVLSSPTAADGSCLEVDTATASDESAAPLVDKASCAVSQSLFTKLSGDSDAACKRIVCFSSSSGKAVVRVKAKEGLTSSHIDHLHLFRACDEGSACRSPSTAFRLAVVVLPMADDSFQGAHGFDASSHASMRIDSVTFDGADNHVEIDYAYEYRPSHDGTRTGCEDNEATGQNDYDGIGKAPEGNTNQDQCWNWGVSGDVSNANRGYSPKLCTVQIGEGIDLYENADNANVFSDDYGPASCSAQSGIKGVWEAAGVTSKTEFAQALYEGKVGATNAADSRAECSALDTALMAQDYNKSMAALSSSMPMAYTSAATSSDPAWSHRVRPASPQSMCGSPYEVQGRVEVSLEQARGCHHSVENAAGNGYAWVPAATQSIANAGAQDETVSVNFNFTMRCYSATKPRSQQSAHIVSQETLKTEVELTTRTYKGMTVTNVKSSDLPAVYLSRVSPKPETPSAGDIETKAGKHVHKECFADCTQRAGSANTCDASCAASCQVALDSDGNVIANSFGRIEVEVDIESLTVGDGELPHIHDTRSFLSTFPSVGAWNVKSVETIDYSTATGCQHKILDGGSGPESTLSKVKITSVMKRLVAVTNFADDGSGYLRHDGASDIIAKSDAFTQAFDVGCDCDEAAAGSSFDPHPKCKFSSPTDFSFQLQVGACGTAAIDGSGTCFSDGSVSQCRTAGEFRTVQLFVAYTNVQQFINPREIVTSMLDTVSQGQLKDSSALSVADATQLVADWTVDAAANQRLKIGEPYYISQEVEDGMQKLGRSWQLHSQTAFMAVHADECSIHLPSSDPAFCGSGGFQLGQCGANIDGSGDLPSLHLFADVILHTNGDNGAKPTAPDDLVAPFRNTAYMKHLVADVAGAQRGVLRVFMENKLGSSLSGNFDLCFTSRGNLANALSMAEDTSVWCFEKNLRSAWDGAQAVTHFLDQAAEHSCIGGIPRTVLLCQSQNCQVLDTVQDLQSTGIQICVSDDRDGFQNHFRLLEVVRDYTMQSEKIALNNYVPGVELPRTCFDVIGDAADNNLQMTGADLADASCAQADRGVWASHRAGAQRVLGSSNSLDTLVAANPRQGQCLGSAKSSRLTQNALDNEEYSLKDRSGMRQHLQFGSSFITPCVRRIAFLESRVTDTRQTCGAQPGQLSLTWVFEGTHGLMAKNLLPIRDGTNMEPTGTGSYLLMTRDADTPCDLTKTDCDQPSAANLADSRSLAYVRGAALRTCGVAIEDSAEEIYDVSMSDGKQWDWSAGLLTIDNRTVYAVDLTKLSTLQNGDPVLPTGFTPVSNGACSGGAASRRSAVPASSPQRQLLTVRTSSNGGAKEQHVEVRRNGDDAATTDVSIVTTVSIAAGAYQTATCANTGVCSQYYAAKSDAEARLCSANEGGMCTLSYCCDLVSITHVTVHNNVDCTSLDSSHTRWRMVFMGAMTIAFFALLLIAGHAVAVRIQQMRCTNVIERQRLCEKPTLVVALELIAVLMFAAASIVGLVGQSEGAWIDVCGLDNSSMWPAWVPLMLSVILGAYYVRMYACMQRKSCSMENQQAPNDNILSIEIGKL